MTNPTRTAAENQATTTANRHPNYGTIGPDDELALGILIAEDEEGNYQPVACVMTINEAKEIAAHNMALRRKRLDQGDAPMCPYVYTVWCRDSSQAGSGASYAVICEIDVATL
jgi:hypothetical protein